MGLEKPKRIRSNQPARTDFFKVFPTFSHAIEIAAACGQSRAADFLINNGADLGVEDSAGDTPPALAVKSENEELISLFEMNKRA